ncbi:MAG: CsbD family protein [Acidiferrobacterales bacterium]
MSNNKDQVKGRADEAQGKVKEVVGKVVGNKDLEVKGNFQKNVGAVRASVGDAKEDIAKTIKTR